MLHNQLYKLVMKHKDTLVLIRETTASQNCEHRDLQTLGLYCPFSAKHQLVNYAIACGSCSYSTTDEHLDQ